MTIATNQPLRAITIKVVHIAFVMLLLTLIKLVEGMPVLELVFFRSLFAVVPLAAYLAWRGDLRRQLHTTRPLGHLWRALLSLFTMAMTFTAVRSLPLAEAVTLQYTQPLWVVALSALVLGEKVRAFRWGAVAIGFAGAVIITWPKLTLFAGQGVGALGTTEWTGAGAALMAAFSLAVTLLWLRELVRTEGSTTITLWLGIYASGLLLLSAPFGWVLPDGRQLALLGLVGLVGIAVQFTLNECLRAAPASTSAPFEYSSLIFAALSGYLIFGHIPDAHTWIGGAVLIAAGLMILWREGQRPAALHPHPNP